MNKHINVTLREKKLKDGRVSLYLDMYPPIKLSDGKETRREFLKIYLVEKPKNANEKELNRTGKAMAENICSERQLQFMNQQHDLSNRLTSKMDFLDFFAGKVKKRSQSKGNQDNWKATYKFLFAYTGGKCQFGDLDEKFCEGFKAYLENSDSMKSEGVKLSKNSQYSYFNKFRAALKEALHEKLLSANPMVRVKGVVQEETQREFLTIEELKVLFNSNCSDPLLKRASIFSALTGLRWSDVIKVTWKEVQYSKQDGYFLRYTQQKTQSVETLPIPEQAYDQLGERGEADERIFNGLKYSAYNNIKLSKWVWGAGIQKNITFHCFRHTYATLQLTMGTDIYTVSKMLGHKNLKTTEIYGKIIDRKKIEAANKIKL